MHRGIVINRSGCSTEGAAPLDVSLIMHSDHVEAACAGTVVDGDPGRVVFTFTFDVDLARADPVVRGVGLTGGGTRHQASCVGRLISDRGDPVERGGAIFVISFLVADDDLDLFDEWYEVDHSTILLSAAGWLRVRRYEPIEVDRDWAWNRLAVHDLRSISVWDAPERLAARNTPLRARVAVRPWFPTSRRWMYTVDEHYRS